MRIASCNIRCYGAKDGDNDWIHRKDFCVEVFREMDADIICCQETWGEQFEDIRAGLPEYDHYGLTNAPTDRKPLNVIFYRRDRFRLISAGGYWLSETPHLVGSKSWESNCPRYVNWLRLEEAASGKEFRIVNTHLDHVSQEARENQARILVEDTMTYPEDYPQFLTGDMNCDHTNEAIRKFSEAGWKDTYEAIHGTMNPGITYHAFIGEDFAAKSDVGKMDFVFARGAVEIRGADIIRTSRDGRFPSDHYFVTGDVEI